MEVGSEGERGSGGVCESKVGGGRYRRGCVSSTWCDERIERVCIIVVSSEMVLHFARITTLWHFARKRKGELEGSGSGGILTVGCSEDVLLGLRGGKVHVRCHVVLLRVGVGHGRRSGAPNVGKHISPKRKY